MTFLNQTGRDFIENSDNITIAHLVTLQLPGTTGATTDLTDFRRDITLEGTVFQAGRIKSIGEVRQTQDLANFNVSVTLSGLVEEELQRVLDSTKYIGRDIQIRRLYMDEDENIVQMTDITPYITYFQGQITSIGIQENTRVSGTGTSDVTWTCSSRLNNFNRVNGRITDDSVHRGLVTENGTQIPSASAKKIEYQTDKGFFHSNQSISVLATYQTQERRYRLVSKRKGGLGGLIGLRSYSTEEYWETVDRDVNLDINLTARYIPIIYGVQRTPAIPVFVDTSFDDPNEVWAVYAICEGEIDGFLDFYIEDQPIICAGSTDSNQRVCVGSKRGNGNTISVNDPQNSSTAPSVHGQKYTFNDGNGNIDIWTYHGTTSQTAASVLVDRARTGGFRIQRLNNDGPEYWDDTFRLTDTAYIVVRMDITENRTNIPSIEAEVQGKKVRVYSQDGSFVEDSTSLNFAWQTLDYLTSTIYGAGIPLNEIPIQPFVDSAALMDTIDTSYQASWVPYWRYLGWQQQSNDNRQVVQGSAFFDTSAEVFKNLQGLLVQFDGSLNIINGQYQLSVEALREPIAEFNINDARPGSFRLDDTTNRNKFNSVQASISDPAEGWNTNAVVFYNSKFLAEDGNIENKGTVPFPFITNYYTARSRAERLLRRSRFSKRVSITLPYRYVELFPRGTVRFTHERYGWVRKEFQVEDLRWKANGDVDLTMVEYDRSTFINSGQFDNSPNQDTLPVVDVLPVTNLRYVPVTQTSSTVGLQGNLVWTGSLSANVAFYTIRRTGSVEQETLSTQGTSPGSEFTFPVRNLDPGPYTFEVRAVNSSGTTSSPVQIIVNLDPSINLPQVSNVRVDNSVGTANEFAGPAVLLSWDQLDTLEDTTYTVEVLDPTDRSLIRSSTVANNSPYQDSRASFIYTLAFNKADYALHNDDALGLYRSLILRVRPTGPMELFP